MVWELSNYVVFPYAGGWLDQPKWVMEAFRTLLRVKRFHRYNDQLQDTTGLPRLDEMN